jgi:hypothetical protein
VRILIEEIKDFLRVFRIEMEVKTFDYNQILFKILLINNNLIILI